MAWAGRRARAIGGRGNALPLGAGAPVGGDTGANRYDASGNRLAYSDGQDAARKMNAGGGAGG
jgi:hypothetical protein